VSQSVPPPLPAERTEPKYRPSSSVTPIPRLPKESDSARAFGQGAVATAILGVIFSAIKEMGGIPVTLAWLGKLTLSTWIVLAIILAIVSAFLYGRQVLSLMQDRMSQHDQQIAAGVNRIGMEQAMHRDKLDDHGERIEVIDDKIDALQEQVAEIHKVVLPPVSPSADTPLQRRSGSHETISADEDTPPETTTAKRRRLAPR